MFGKGGLADMDLMTSLAPYKEQLKKCPLFAGIPEDQYEKALCCLKAGFHHVKRGAVVQRVGETFRYAIYVLEGCLEGSFMNRASDEIKLNQFLPGSLMGESFAFIRNEKSNIQVTAVCESVYLTFDLCPLVDSCSGCANCFVSRHVLLANLMYLLAHQNVFLNQKVRLLSQKGTRDRLLFYLNSLPANSKGYVTLPFSKTDLAAFLCLNRSAMSRELSRMEEEGILEISGRRIRISGGQNA